MNYLVFAVYADMDSGNVATHSKQYATHLPVEDCQEDILTSLEKTGMERELLHEVFVFKSAQNFGSAPETSAHWTAEDIAEGDSDGDSDEEDDESDETDFDTASNLLRG